MHPRKSSFLCHVTKRGAALLGIVDGRGGRFVVLNFLLKIPISTSKQYAQCSRELLTDDTPLEESMKRR